MKKIILIGSQCWFADSFTYFIEKGFKGTVIKCNHNTKWFFPNYSIFNKIGFSIVDIKDLQIDKLGLDENTLIISDYNFSGGIKSKSVFKLYSEEILDIAYKISKYNKDNNCGATVVRGFNGDTGFGSIDAINMFNEKIKYLDALIFDNSLLEEFVLKNIPNANNIKRYLGWMETPLERFVKNNTDAKINKSYISLGRVLCSSIIDYGDKVKFTGYEDYFDNQKINRKNIDNIILGWQNNLDYFVISLFGIKISYKKKRRLLHFNLAGGCEDINNIYNDRKIFFNNYNFTTFGLSHFYDIFNNSIENFLRNKDFYFSLDGQNVCSNILSPKEMYYSFINNPSKDVTYLMNGIIPLISHNLHNVYKEFIDKKMAILIKTEDDIENTLNISDYEILEYRENIYKNRHLFTFEKTVDLLINLLDKK